MGLLSLYLCCRCGVLSTQDVKFTSVPKVERKLLLTRSFLGLSLYFCEGKTSFQGSVLRYLVFLGKEIGNFLHVQEAWPAC